VADAERGAEVGGIVEGITGFDAGDGVTLQVGRPVGQVAVDGDRLDGAGEADGAVVGVGGAGQCRQQDKDSAEGRVGTPLGRAG
jgi:hypothetical protein